MKKAHGVKYTSEESWVAWALFPSSMTDEEIFDTLDHPSAFYQGPGRAFADAPVIWRVGKRALFTQRGGLDV